MTHDPVVGVVSGDDPRLRVHLRVVIRRPLVRERTVVPLLQLRPTAEDCVVHHLARLLIRHHVRYPAVVVADQLAEGVALHVNHIESGKRICRFRLRFALALCSRIRSVRSGFRLLVLIRTAAGCQRQEHRCEKQHHDRLFHICTHLSMITIFVVILYLLKLCL